MRKINLCAAFMLFALSLSAKALPPDNTQLAVWANEAIIATYTFDYKNFLDRQKEIAKYFTAGGWTAYSTAITTSKLPDAVKANSYYVSAVATLPPEITSIGPNQWQAKMPILVIYKNPQYQQKQNLDVTIHFTQAPAGQGVRGFAIMSLQSKISTPPCQCSNEPSEPDTTSPTAPK
jgi:hypothetical protein